MNRDINLIFVEEIKNMKRETIYKFLYQKGVANKNLTAYSLLFLLRQIFYFLKGKEAFIKFGNRALTEHFPWEIEDKK